MKDSGDFNAVIIEASAGTGKTRWITEKFLALLGKDDPASDIRKILAVTFSEKAAIEMKNRILAKIYKDIFPELSESKQVELENAMLKLRISTIHSFCRLLLKRFSFYNKMDPFFNVINKRENILLSYRAFNSFMNNADPERWRILLKNIKLTSLRKDLFDVLKTHPYATIGVPAGDMTTQIAKLGRDVSEISSRIKRELSMMDFNDLEMITYQILTETPEAINILEDFDEKNNFIFVDEFQDTNLLQWRIISKLVEEWISGDGAKAEAGRPYGVFLVGDRKQSIYKFRGAEGKVFDEAKTTLNAFCTEKKLLKNYRSAPEIINFVNKVFEDNHPWAEEKLSPGIEGMPNNIELNFPEGEDPKFEEYQWVAGKILELINNKALVMDKHTKEYRPIEFHDIAILMRKRVGKKYKLLEKTLKESGIPFVILGGMGFYKEPEIIFLMTLVLAIADPSDKLSLWNLYSSTYRITYDKVIQWRKYLKSKELVDALEIILQELNFWEGISTQQKANIEKFLMIVDEWKGTPLYHVSGNLRAIMSAEEEPKADIFSEHQNAVSVLTVHSAKGLEFPSVFLVNLEDGAADMKKDTILYKKTEGESPYEFILKGEATKEYKDEYKNMIQGEELRVLYVALTRACQYLFISGTGERTKGVWMPLLEKFQTDFPATMPKMVPVKKEQAEQPKQKKTISIKIDHSGLLTSYTEEKQKAEYHYEGTVAGEIAHKLIYELSTGRINSRDNYIQRVDFYLKKSGFDENKKLWDMLVNIYELIDKTPELKKIVEKREDGFSETPFIVKKEGKIYTGFIDRIILDAEESCYIYDYKTEKGDADKFKQQMDIYEEAVRKIFPQRKRVKRYIVFLQNGKIQEI